MSGRRRLAPVSTALVCLVAGLSTEVASGVVPGAPGASMQAVEQRRQALSREDIEALIDTAARRFGVPRAWIRAVMRQESGFDPRATSHAGAMGLMQVMPATYAELRRRYGLGPDPYDPRDNVLAGTAYLRELHDLFGPDGMLAAYNAGPGRYLQHRDGGRPLPLETRDYIRRIGRLEGRLGSAGPVSSGAVTPVIDPFWAPLFPASPPGPPAPANSPFVALAPSMSGEPE